MKRLLWSPYTTKEQHLARLRNQFERLNVDPETWERLAPEKLNRYQLEALIEVMEKATVYGMAVERSLP